METVLSGIKPTGKLTLGNYIGALKNFPKFQDENRVFLFIADLHALTLPIDPDELYQNTKDIVAFYLACGLDPEKSSIFLQSHVGEHAELSAILGNYAYMGELSRMTQFKEKIGEIRRKTNRIRSFLLSGSHGRGYSPLRCEKGSRRRRPEAARRTRQKSRYPF